MPTFGLREILENSACFANVTIVCGDGSKIRAHQLILAAYSSYFRDFLRDNPSKHPIVFLPVEIGYPELRAMIEFMYTGQVCVSQDRLQAFISGARYLRIKGLEDNAADSGNNSTAAATSAVVLGPGRRGIEVEAKAIR